MDISDNIWNLWNYSKAFCAKMRCAISYLIYCFGFWIIIYYVTREKHINSGNSGGCCQLRICCRLISVTKLRWHFKEFLPIQHPGTKSKTLRAEFLSTMAAIAASCLCCTPQMLQRFNNSHIKTILYTHTHAFPKIRNPVESSIPTLLLTLRIKFKYGCHYVTNVLIDIECAVTSSAGKGGFFMEHPWPLVSLGHFING